MERKATSRSNKSNNYCQILNVAHFSTQRANHQAFYHHGSLLGRFLHPASEGNIIAD
jgi:hypothetical protein